MPTFENGWICRECWCSNREHDQQCYRCHAPQPEYVRTAAQTATAPGPEGEASEVVKATVDQREAVDEANQGASSARPSAQDHRRYCLTCGRALLPGASFCTQCGSPANHDAPTETSLGGAPSVVPGVGVDRQSQRRADLNPRAAIRRARSATLEFVERHAKDWELTMAALALTYVLLGVVAQRWPPAADLALVAQGSITLLFVAEFAMRLLIASDRLQFIRGHPIELIAVIPPFRALRIVTLARWSGLPGVLTRARELPRHRSALQHRRQLPTRWLLFVLWLTLAAVATLTIYQFGGGLSAGGSRLIVALFITAAVSLLSASTAALVVHLSARRTPLSSGAPDPGKGPTSHAVVFREDGGSTTSARGARTRG